MVKSLCVNKNFDRKQQVHDKVKVTTKAKIKVYLKKLEIAKPRKEFKRQKLNHVFL
ncbi:hypothetical protein NUSPORA_01762 [Nucleospora cyclopteri]